VVSSHTSASRNGNHADLNSAGVPKSLSTSRMHEGSRDTPRRCGGSFAEQVAGNVKGEAPMRLWERPEIRLDENHDGLFAGINLDPNRCIAKVNLVASSVLSANDGVGHYCLACSDRPIGRAQERSGSASI